MFEMAQLTFVSVVFPNENELCSASASVDRPFLLHETLQKTQNIHF